MILPLMWLGLVQASGCHPERDASRRFASMRLGVDLAIVADVQGNAAIALRKLGELVADLA